ncbi:hypothetical protein KIN20_027894 [Parelaphostrongylus tenuis]|uniref:Uncharacterized protein n=1 Tax=Parelaphostrongylus tenuis TaxID=148309 RepID=A0AAD5R048_PARTN|nr:hypothetical protein KIN20_027894 [Parelaphostrongylus tenuis]
MLMLEILLPGFCRSCDQYFFCNLTNVKVTRISSVDHPRGHTSEEENDELQQINKKTARLTKEAKPLKNYGRDSNKKELPLESLQQQMFSVYTEEITGI